MNGTRPVHRAAGSLAFLLAAPCLAVTVKDPSFEQSPSAWTGKIGPVVAGCTDPGFGSNAGYDDSGAGVYQDLTDASGAPITFQPNSYTLKVDVSPTDQSFLQLGFWQVRLNAVDLATGDVQTWH